MKQKKFGVFLCWIGFAVFAVFIGEIGGMIIWQIWKGGTL
jgi:hypothetical protein